MASFRTPNCLSYNDLTILLRLNNCMENVTSRVTINQTCLGTMACVP